MSEANEPPNATAERELKEELGRTLTVGKLLVIDWVSPHGPWDDSLMLIFDGGVLDQEQIAGLRLLDGELRAFEFCDQREAAKRLRAYVWQRVSAALSALATGAVEYLSDGN